MSRKENCYICGQKLTDASGSWKLVCKGTGIMTRNAGRDWGGNICSYCCDSIVEFIDKKITLRNLTAGLNDNFDDLEDFYAEN